MNTDRSPFANFKLEKHRGQKNEAVPYSLVYRMHAQKILVVKDERTSTSKAICTGQK